VTPRHGTSRRGCERASERAALDADEDGEINALMTRKARVCAREVIGGASRRGDVRIAMREPRRSPRAHLQECRAIASEPVPVANHRGRIARGSERGRAGA
jgi:hypothetical protein